MATLQQIKDQIYFLVNEPNTSSIFDYTTRVLPKINNVSNLICQGNYKDTITGQIYKSGDLRFLRKKVFIEYKPGSTITNDITPTSTLIDTDTTNFTNSGYAIIKGNVFSYTAKTTTQLIGCSGIIGSFKSGSKIEQVFKIPINSDRTFQLFIIKDDNLLSVQYQDAKDENKYYGGFSIIEDGTLYDNFLYIFGQNQEFSYWLYYYSKHIDLVNLTDVSIFPDNVCIEVIAKICAGELLVETEMDNQGNTLLRQGYSKLHTFYVQEQFEDRHKKVLSKKPIVYY